MGGLRDIKKLRSKKRIIEVSTEIFLSRGYNETTMEEIAEKAEIGVGTLYNYFPSKADIFVSIVSDKFEDLQQKDFSLNHVEEKDAVDIVIVFINQYVKFFKFLSKKLWKELFSVAMGNMKSSDFMLRTMMKLDFKYIDKLEELLQKLKNTGLLSEKFQTTEGAQAIYSVIMMQMMMYIYMDDVTYEDFTKKVESQVKFIFEGKGN